MSLLKHVASTVLVDHLKAKYHIMETTFSILQLFDHVTDFTQECACVLAMNLCNKLFVDNFQVCYSLTSKQNTLMLSSLYHCCMVLQWIDFIAFAYFCLHCSHVCISSRLPVIIRIYVS